MKDLKDYAPFVLRLGVGGAFLIAGVLKLLNTKGTIEMLKSIDFPMASIMGIVLLLTEIGFGLAVLIGYKLKYTIWPLAIVLLVAILGIYLPAVKAGEDTTGFVLLLHGLGLSALFSLFLSGPGALAITGKSSGVEEALNSKH